MWICESPFKFDPDKSDEGIACMNFLEKVFIWTMVATIVLGVISVVHIGLFKMNLLAKIKTFFQNQGNRRKSSKLLCIYISRLFLELFKVTWILLDCFSRVNGRNLVARKAGRVSMESFTSNRMTVNASKMMNSGKLIEFYHIICTITYGGP